VFEPEDVGDDYRDWSIMDSFLCNSRHGSGRWPGFAKVIKI